MGRSELSLAATFLRPSVSVMGGGSMTWIVHVGGLVQTGSGAVKDALLDTTCFLTLKGKPFAMSESRLFVGRPTIPWFVGRTQGLTGMDVLALWTAGTRLPDGAVIAPETRRFVQRTVASHGVNQKFLRVVDDATLLEAAEATAADIARATSARERGDAYILGTRAAMRQLLPLDGRMVLIDNDPAVSTHIRRHLRLDSDSVFVGVIRDVSDQYIDRRRIINHDQSRLVNLGYVIVSGLIRRRYFRELLAAVEEFPERCLIVEFESFVQDAEYRERLLKSVAAGADAREREREPRFVPEMSAKNIGLSVSKGDALQHAVYTGLIRGPYRRAQQRSGPNVWPEAATMPR